MFRKCVKCNKIFAMKKCGKNLVKNEDITMLERLTQPNIRGELQTMVERFVLGERRFYEIKYICKFCGAVHIKTMCKDIKTK